MQQQEVLEPISDQSRPRRGAKIDKVKRYAWRMEHSPGKCQLVSKHAINVDHRYQRMLNELKRRDIAGNFNWVAFGAISVNRRVDGSLWAIDGQHRLAAAKTRDDINELPCVIFEIPNSIEEEAAAFLALNTLRRPLSSKDRFRAQLVSGNQDAILVETMIKSSGRSVDSRSPGTGIECLTALMSIVREDANNARIVWPLIADICEGERIDNRLVQGIAYLERRLLDENGEKRSLLESDNKRKLIEAGLSSVLKAIGEAAAFYHRGGQVVFARGILNIVNYRRQKRFKLKGQSDEE